MTSTAAYVEVPSEFYRVVLAHWTDAHPGLAESLSEFSHVEGTRYYVNGWAGFAIRPDGELVLVHAWGKGHGDHLMTSAIAFGATRLDCFDGYLPTFYARHGFVEDRRESNWTPGEPDIVFMTRS